MGEDKNRLGQRLVKSGILTEEQLDEALEFQASIGGRLGAILIKLGLIEPDQLTKVLSIMCQVPVIKADDIFIDHKLIKSFKEEVLRKHNFIPISSTATSIKIAASDPSDVDVINFVEFETEKSVELCTMSHEDIQRVLNLVFSQCAPSQLAKDVQGVKAGKAVSAENPRAQVRNHSFRDILLAVVDELHSKGIVEYRELLDRIEQS